jgi:hypothetical protein
VSASHSLDSILMGLAQTSPAGQPTDQSPTWPTSRQPPHTTPSVGPTPEHQQAAISGTIWPRSVAPDRYLRLAFPYDTFYRNERGILKELAMSSGLSSLTYLSEHQKMATAVIAEPFPGTTDLQASALFTRIWSSHGSPEPSASKETGEGKISVWAMIVEQLGLQRVEQTDC